MIHQNCTCIANPDAYLCEGLSKSSSCSLSGPALRAWLAMPGEVSPSLSLWPSARQHDHRGPLPHCRRPWAVEPAPVQKITDLRRLARTLPSCSEEGATKWKNTMKSDDHECRVSVFGMKHFTLMHLVLKIRIRLLEFVPCITRTDMTACMQTCHVKLNTSV